ncbi:MULTISPECIES: hypothetical protein [Hydrocarboniphaga]|nr:MULTISPECIES: hypothetical protein [Hydrocarboniphaga]MDZ4077173.1 hypothetical protein [Hydrocarboniphaga sp.]
MPNKDPRAKAATRTRKPSRPIRMLPSTGKPDPEVAARFVRRLIALSLEEEQERERNTRK